LAKTLSRNSEARALHICFPVAPMTADEGMLQYARFIVYKHRYTRACGSLAGVLRARNNRKQLIKARERASSSLFPGKLTGYVRCGPVFIRHCFFSVPPTPCWTGRTISFVEHSDSLV